VIRPNATGILSSDVPHRIVVSGFFRLAVGKWSISPVADVHSGCHIQMWTFCKIIGLPDNQRFPLYFSA